MYVLYLYCEAFALAPTNIMYVLRFKTEEVTTNFSNVTFVNDQQSGLSIDMEYAQDLNPLHSDSI